MGARPKTQSASPMAMPMDSAMRSLSETVRGANHCWVNSTATATARQKAPTRATPKGADQPTRRIPSKAAQPRKASGT